MAFPAAHQTATVTTFDGLELTVQLAKIDGEPWALLDARQVEAVAPAASAEPAPEDATGEPPAATGNQEAVDIEPPPAPGDAPGTEDVSAAEDTSPAEPLPLTAGEVNQRVQPWAFKVSSFVFDRLTKPRSEWLDDAGTS